MFKNMGSITWANTVQFETLFATFEHYELNPFVFEGTAWHCRLALSIYLLLFGGWWRKSHIKIYFDVDDGDGDSFMLQW
jgi:hypothetical protein